MADKKMTQDEYEKQSALKTLHASFWMYEDSKKETRRFLEDALNEDGSKKYDEEYIENRINLIQNMQDDIIEQYKTLGGTEEEIKKPLKKNKTVKTSEKRSLDKSILEKAKKNKETLKKEMPKSETKGTIGYIPKQKDFDNSVAFDVIPLPSNGEVYKDKIERIRVSYLTANDENMFVSPNLYRDGMLIDCLLNEKIMDSGIDPSDLIEGDRDAIILWLRATGYGNEFPITATDDKTGTQFETVVDLSKIKFKDFTLKSDENGLFEYKLPVSGKEIKFKYLTHRENEELKKMDSLEKANTIKLKLEKMNTELREMLDSDTDLKKAEKDKLYEACRNIEDWGDSLDEEDETLYTHTLTNRLFMNIVSIDGNKDRDFIYNFVLGMNVRDSLSLRKYINENEPGLDFKFQVEKPESLGGGSQDVFLSVDQFIFLNIA